MMTAARHLRVHGRPAAGTRIHSTAPTPPMVMKKLLRIRRSARSGLFCLALVVALAFALQACEEDLDPSAQSEESISASGAGSLSGEATGPGGAGPGVVPPTETGSPGGTPSETGTTPSDAGSGAGPEPSLPSLSLPGGPSEGRLDGDPCTADTQCVGGTCLQDPQWPDGYCTTVGCTTREDCLNREEYGCLPGQGGFPSICVLLCEEAADCRTGYICQAAGNASYCAPDPNQATPTEPPVSNGGGNGAGAGEDGDSCSSAADCIGDKCLTGSQWPGGYCSTSCATDEDCNREGLGFGGFGLPGALCSGGTCYANCAAGFGCREGYRCDDSLSDTPSIGGCIGE